MTEEELATAGVFTGMEPSTSFAGLVLCGLLIFAVNLVNPGPPVPGARRAPGAGVGATTLAMKPDDHPVESQSVVETGLNQFHKNWPQSWAHRPRTARFSTVTGPWAVTASVLHEALGSRLFSKKIRLYRPPHRHPPSTPRQPRFRKTGQRTWFLETWACPASGL